MKQLAILAIALTVFSGLAGCSSESGDTKLDKASPDAGVAPPEGSAIKRRNKPGVAGAPGGPGATAPAPGAGQ